MAINPGTKWPTRTTAAAPAYPYGSSQDETSPGANDGTPYEKARADDIFGLQQALLKFAGIVPSGNADTAQISQYLEALLDMAMGGGFFEDTGAADAYLFTVISADRQGPVAYTDGMRVSARIVNTNTGASTVNVNSVAAVNIFYKGAALTAGMLTVGDIVVLIYDDANSRFDLLVSDTLFMDLFKTQTIAGAKTFLSAVTISHLNATLSIRELSATADEGNWDFLADNDSLKLRAVNDALDSAAVVFQVARTGTVIDLFNISSTNLQHNGNEVITDADLATLEHSSKNAGVVTLLLTATAITSIDMGTVDNGDRFIVTAITHAIVKGATGGETGVWVLQSAGTATVVFCEDEDQINHTQDHAATNTAAITLCGVLKVTGGGTLTMQSTGQSIGSNSTIPVGGGQIHAIKIPS